MRVLLFSIAVSGLLGCQPELPNRSCKTTKDCFTQEICAQKKCVSAHRPAPTDQSVESDITLPDLAMFEQSDGGNDAL